MIPKFLTSWLSGPHKKMRFQFRSSLYLFHQDLFWSPTRLKQGVVSRSVWFLSLLPQLSFRFLFSFSFFLSLRFISAAPLCLLWFLSDCMCIDWFIIDQSDPGRLALSMVLWNRLTHIQWEWTIALPTHSHAWIMTWRRRDAIFSRISGSCSLNLKKRQLLSTTAGLIASKCPNFIPEYEPFRL